MTLVIYDTSSGIPIMTRDDEETIKEVSSVLADVPKGYIVTGVNPETKEVYIEPSESQSFEDRLEALERANTDQDKAIMSMANELYSEE